MITNDLKSEKVRIIEAFKSCEYSSIAPPFSVRTIAGVYTVTSVLNRWQALSHYYFSGCRRRNYNKLTK